MASADDAHSRAKRPAAMARQSSAQSHRSQSPPDGHSRPVQHKAQRHVVGQRVQRNTSFGKNLNKLNKLTQQVQQAQQATEAPARHHRRTQSGDSASTPSSPRPGVKRNSSSGSNVKGNHQVHAQTHLRKNHSSGHLARQGHVKQGLMRSKSDLGSSRRGLGNRSRSHQSSPEPHASVHFDVDSDEEGGDDGWTEESASQSPTTTRSNTRSNSVILEAQHKIARENMENNRGAPVQATEANDSPPQASQALADRTRNNTRTNGGSSQAHSRLPDADMITSRLLQRSASNHVAPITSSTATTVVASSGRQTLLNHSGASTLVDQPGKELVSRFMDGDGSAGASQEGGYLSSRNGSKGEASTLDKSKRNQSMPNVSGTETPSKTPQRSGTTTPTNLPPSRTQQKLMLQRASSNIEPQKLVPVTLPRSGGPAFLSSSVHYNADGEGRLDPRLQQYFNHVAVEYNVVRRYRNPLADALGRISQTPGIIQKPRTPKSATGANGFTKAQGTNSSGASYHEAGLDTDGLGLRRSRVSFDNSPGNRRASRDNGDSEGRPSFESDQARSRNEAEEICRRMWESAEVVEGD